MSRWLALGAVAIFSSGCGLLIDGAYLLTDRHTHQQVEQRRPTDQSETKPERRLAFEGPELRVACEDVTRGVDRVWTVDKDFEYQGGLYQAHWIPVLLEGIIGGALAIGIGVRCQDPTSQISCNLLYGTIPFGIDVSYSLVRLLTINPPKLVDKRLTAPHTEARSEPSSRVAVACDSETTVVATAPAAQGARVQFPVEPHGWVRPEDQAELIAYTLKHHGTQVALYSGNRQVTPDVGRCELLAAMKTANPTGANVPPDCVASAPRP